MNWSSARNWGLTTGGLLKLKTEVTGHLAEKQPEQQWIFDVSIPLETNNTERGRPEEWYMTSLLPPALSQLETGPVLVWLLQLTIMSVDGIKGVDWSFLFIPLST